MYKVSAIERVYGADMGFMNLSRKLQDTQLTKRAKRSDDRDGPKKVTSFFDKDIVLFDKNKNSISTKKLIKYCINNGMIKYPEWAEDYKPLCVLSYNYDAEKETIELLTVDDSRLGYPVNNIFTGTFVKDSKGIPFIQLMGMETRDVSHTDRGLLEIEV